MTEFEDRLRAAMESSVAAEDPPANLVARVRRRHRRHLVRLGIAWIAAAAAVVLVVTLQEGNAAATFTACSDQAAMFGGGFTEYYVGVIVAGPRCVTFDVRTSAREQPIRATLRFDGCG